MEALDSNMDKKYLLDVLAYFLWEEKTACELGFLYIRLCKRLYKEILEELKKEAALWQDSSPYRDDFGTINRKCQDIGDLFFLEKRLEMLEQRLAEKV